MFVYARNLESEEWFKIYFFFEIKNAFYIFTVKKKLMSDDG